MSDETQPKVPETASEFLEEPKPKKLEDFFPLENPRSSQEQAIAKIESSFNKGKIYTILELPTGTGKSPIAICTAKWAAQLPEKDHRPGAYILTTQKTLTAQYMRDFAEKDRLVEIRGQANYTCEPFSTDCSVGTKLGKHSETGKCDSCPYRDAKHKFLRSPYGVTNFSYFLNEVKHGGQLKPRKLLIIDECHNAEKEILNFADLDITQHRADACAAGDIPQLQLGRKQEWSIKFNEAAKDWLGQVFMPASAKYMNDLDLESDQLYFEGESLKAAQVTRRLSAWEKFHSKIAQFVLTPDLNDWITFSDNKGSLIIKPLTATLFAKDVLLERAEHVVMMSATILDPRTFARNLGMDSKTCGYLSLPSDFPVENRPIYYKPQGSMSYHSKAETLPKMIKFIERILLKFKDVKGIIHTNSYETNRALTDYLYRTDQASRVISHGPGPGSREDAVASHTMSPDPTVLISPSMTEGLDLKDDLSRFQIIMKIPYPFLDPYTKTRMRRDEDWYQLQTALTLIQATGRSNRSVDDLAATFILDSAFDQFLGRNQRILPSWWTDAII